MRIIRILSENISNDLLPNSPHYRYPFKGAQDGKIKSIKQKGITNENK